MKAKRIGSLLVAAAMLTAAASGCASGSKVEKTLKIGGIGPTTGNNAQYGEAVRNGAQIAVDEINKAGGIAGMQIEYKFSDDESDNEKAVNAYNTLKDWGMNLLMGTVTSNPCIAVAEKTKDDNMFQLTPSGTAADCVKYDNAFRVCFSDPNQGKQAAKYIADHKLAAKIAVIYDSSDPYSTGIFENFNSESKNVGLSIVETQAFTKDNKTDFSVQLQKAKDSGADMVFLPIYYSEASQILKQAKSVSGFSPKYFGCDGMDGILSMENFDASLAQNLMFMTPFDANASDDKTQNFVSSYKSKFDGATPNQFAADAYDAIYIIKAACEKAGLKDGMSNSDLCDAMKKAMTEIKVTGVTGTDMVWSSDGEPNKEPRVVQIKDGAYTSVA